MNNAVEDPFSQTDDENVSLEDKNKLLLYKLREHLTRD